MKQTEKIISIEQAYFEAMNTYPTLYCGKNKKESILKFYDHIFNCIGNGYNTKELFFNHFSFENNLHYSVFDEKYINSEDLFVVFDKEQGILDDYFTSKEIDSLNKNLFEYMPLEQSDFVPYPNFQKKYSTLFRKEIQPLLNESWLTAMKFFYKECKEFFNSERIHDYHYYFPRAEDNNKWKKIINDYSKSFKKYEDGSKNNEEVYDKISKAYELQYNGDIKQFIINRGNLNKKENLNFIEEAFSEIDFLLKKLTPNQKNNHKSVKIR